VGALLLAISVGLLFGWLYSGQKARVAQSKLREAELELEKQELTNSLVYKSKELTATMMYLLEKNQLLSSMAQELARYKNDFSQKNQVVIQRIINELLKNSTKKAWEEFEVHFTEVHVDFYPNLQRRFPDLTLNERRLCAFLKLNLTTKEIGAITHQSTEAINMARFRLRRKLGLESEHDLAGFIGTI
jgi:DNA-binding CsgD family transcriptional regulator